VTRRMAVTGEPQAWQKLIAGTCAKQQLSVGQLAVHADRGSSMTSKPVAFLIAYFGHHPVAFPAARLQRQPQLPVQDAEYWPDFPERFASIQHARVHCQVFSPWFNTEHRHSALGPAHRRCPLGSCPGCPRSPRCGLAAAYAAYPERFAFRPPRRCCLPRPGSTGPSRRPVQRKERPLSPRSLGAQRDPRCRDAGEITDRRIGRGFP
jgi:putative transposase